MTQIRHLKKSLFTLLLFVLSAGLSLPAIAQDQGADEEETEEKSEGNIKPYDEVITEDAVSDPGMFTIHRVNENFYMEIPDSLLNRDMIIVSRRAAMSSSDLENLVAGERPTEPLTVRWEKSPDGQQIFMKKVTTRNQLRYNGADGDHFKNSLKLQTLDPILISFPIQAKGQDSESSVVSSDPLFLDDVKELTPFRTDNIFVLLGFMPPKKYAFKQDRSYIEDVKSFDQNLEVRSMLTYTEGNNPDVYSVLMHRSMILLPEEPMQPRIADERIGHFAISFKEYNETNPVSMNHYIRRWRLEPREEDIEKFEAGELVEPKEKITFYLDESTPEKWRDYIKEGVEDWLPAFEEAGFKNAIEAIDIPDDPDFHPEDVRYSVIRYAASEIPNAKGPSVVDPRSGEIMESGIIIYHNVLKLLRDWRFSQTAASDPDVRTTNISDEIMGDALQFVVAHEVGHALGLRHNMGASSAFPVDSLRSASFTEKYGTSPSIMDYARFNYVAQPEDEGVTVTPPSLGVYDKYAINWAYRPILEAEDEFDEVATLNSWIDEHAGDPWYYFGEGDVSSADPRSMKESLGDDVVKASEYGVKNIKYIIDNLDNWLLEEGQKYDTLEDLYKSTVLQFNRYLGHVGTLIAGVKLERPRQGDAEPFYQYIEKEKQREAVQFLLRQYREIPQWLENENLKNKLNLVQYQAGGLVRRIIPASNYIERLYYSSLRRDVINSGKLMFLIDNEASGPADAYTARDLFDDIREDVFRETVKGEKPDYYRQLFQNVYVNWLLDKAHINNTVAPVKSFSDDLLGSSAPLCSYDHTPVLEALKEHEASDEVIEAYASQHNLHFQMMDLQRFDKQVMIESMVLAEVKIVKNIIEKGRKKRKIRKDEAVAGHYDYLLRRIDVFLNAGK